MLNISTFFIQEMGKDFSLPIYIYAIDLLFIGRADPPYGLVNRISLFVKRSSGGQTPPLQSIAKSKGGISALAILFKTIENVAFGSHPAWCKLRLHYTRLYAGDNL